jgi:hypothetical protein
MASFKLSLLEDNSLPCRLERPACRSKCHNMQPLAVLLGIVMGSTVSIAAGLAMTVIVFLALPEYSERLQGEIGPLLQYFLGASVLAVLSALAFLGELRQRSWRRSAQAAMALSLLSTVAWYWWRWRNR